MNKEKEIEKMAKTIELIKSKALNTVGSLNKGYGMFYAEHLVSAGIGDKKQAVKEFADELKHKINALSDMPRILFNSIMDQLITELYGADE